MKKVLIFSNGEQIGDGILKLPIVYQLKDRFPNYEIHWMTDTIYTEYNQRLKKFTSNHIDKIWEKAKLNPFFWKKISNVYNLNNEEFDIIIDTQKAVPRTIALKRLKTKIFISSTANWFFSNLKPKAFSKETTYKKELFDEALLDGKVVVVSSWIKYCTSCASQMKILKKAKNDFDNIEYFAFDVTNKEIAKFLTCNIKQHS